jgi:hypothetical protein
MKTQKILLLRIAFGLISYLWIIFGAHQANAQPPFYPQNKPMLRMDGQDAYWKSSPLRLTEDQIKALESLQQAFIAEAIPLRGELMYLRIELRHLIRDQNVPSKTLLEWQRKISELQGKLENLSLSHQIKARSIFTKDQLEQLPPDFSMATGFETDIGIGRGVRKGIR